MNKVLDFKTRSDLLKSKLFNLNSLGIDTSEYQSNLEVLNKRYANLSHTTSTTIGNVAIESQTTDDKMEKQLVRELNELESSIQTSYMYYDLINNCNIINNEENEKFDQKLLDSSSKLLIKFLEYFSSLDHRDFKNLEIAIDAIYSAIYKLIKIEYRTTNGKSSLLLYSLLKNGFDLSHLSNLINEDITNLKDKRDLEKIKNIIKENPMSDNVNKDIIVLLAINEGTYKKDMINDLESVKQELMDKIDEFSELTEKKHAKNIHTENAKKQLKKRTIASLIASAGIFAQIGIMTVTSLGTKAWIKSKYNTEYTGVTSEYYDTLSGTGESHSYFENPVTGDAKVRICYPVREDGTRYEEVYLFDKNQYNTAEEYATANFDEAILLSSSNVLDTEANNISNDKFIISEVVKTIDKNDKMDMQPGKYDGDYYGCIATLHGAIVFIFVILNCLLDSFGSYWSANFFNCVRNKLNEDNLIYAIKEYINNLDKLKDYDPKTYKKMKKEIDLLRKKNAEVLLKYSSIPTETINNGINDYNKLKRIL